MKLYGIRSCSTCRTAKADLKRAGHDVILHDVRDDPLSHDTLSRLHEAFGDTLINRRSTTWRDLDDAARATDPVALLSAHPTLMKRPVIETDGALHLGWGPEVRAALT